jgi:hypothetical protein
VQSNSEPQSIAEIESEYPTWQVWEGVNQMFYARLIKSSPPVVITGEDLLDLRDQIRGWIGRHTGYIS